MKWMTRPAAWRLLIVGLLAACLGVGAWLAMIKMPLQSHHGPWTPLDPREQSVRAALQRDIQALAGDIGERNLLRPHRLDQAAEFIAASFASAGFAVRRQPYQVQGVPCANLEVELRGRTHPEEIVVIGAHYDSVIGSPGANDNASGVAALLALARAFHGAPGARTLRLVAFVNEEPPFFQTRNMGSLVYARAARERDDNIVAMLSLETIGYYTDRKRSQRYPFPVGLFYPSRGNFIAFVGRTADRGLVRRCVELFRQHAEFPSEGGALPAGLPGIGWSDHWAFWQAGYPAVMVTDTAPFRYPHYHGDDDTPDKLQYEALARVVVGLEAVVRELLGADGRWVTTRSPPSPCGGVIPRTVLADRGGAHRSPLP